MSKLTDTQLVLLSKASQREDRAVEPPARLNGRAAAMIETLIQRRLLDEVAAERAMPVYRHAEVSNEPRALVITDLGLIAIGVTSEIEPREETVIPAQARGAKPNKKPNAAKGPAKDDEANRSEPQPAGKTGLVLKLMQRKEGASIAAMTEATGWLPHSARAVLTGLRKKGFAIERGKAADQTTIYKIARKKAA